MASSKIAVYSLPDLKNTTDDALPNYLTSLQFKQSHFLTDVRLLLGYAGVAIAAVTFYLDYALGWDKTKDLTLWAVVAYFVLNSALTYWIWGVEKGKVFTGEKGNTLLSVATSVKKHMPVYNVTVRYSAAPGDWKTLELSAPFTRWFDADGFFVAKPFQQWLASEAPVIGDADPQNAAGKTEGISAAASGSEDNAAAAGQPTPSSAEKPTVDYGTPSAKFRIPKRKT